MLTRRIVLDQLQLSGTNATGVMTPVASTTDYLRGEVYLKITGLTLGSTDFLRLYFQTDAEGMGYHDQGCVAIAGPLTNATKLAAFTTMRSIEAPMVAQPAQLEKDGNIADNTVAPVELLGTSLRVKAVLTSGSATINGVVLLSEA